MTLPSVRVEYLGTLHADHPSAVTQYLTRLFGHDRRHGRDAAGKLRVCAWYAVDSLAC